MALTRLDNLISSKTGKYLYVSPDDFNASDELNNRGNSPIRPFKSIQRAFIETARYSYLPGPDNDRFDQFTIMLMPGKHYIDNRPGLASADGITPFTFNQALTEWEDSSNLDIGDPNNKLYLFNNTEGGAIIPRGSSLVGYDLRRTAVHPLYVPDPADRLETRSAIFNVTGGCYFWQFTIRDGDLEPSSPLYDVNEGVGKVYTQNGRWDEKEVPNFSHHKLTVFEYADKEELGLYYQKVAKAFSQYQPTIDDPGEFSDRVQETRIVGPLSDFRSVESITCTDSSPAGTITVKVTSKVNHGYFKNQFVAIENNGLDEQIDGTFAISQIDLVDQRVFYYQIPGTVAALGTITNLVSGTPYTAQNGLSPNAVVKAEVDTVESASPYVFNCSIRSTWGICGIWANGLKATGFKSMVIAQYTGVSLQKDDRAFIRYDEYTNTFNQAPLTDAFATIPYHTKGDAFWKDDWRNFHVRASEDAFIQCVSIFAVGYADHFLMESGGDMSITNSNSNFGNTSLHAIGHKGYAFAQDKGGYVTDIIPPQIVQDTTGNTKKNAYYTLDVKASNDQANHTKIFIGDDSGIDPGKRPAATIDGYRIGARSNEKIFVKLTPRTAGGDNIFSATLSPTGFKKFTASADVLNPSGVTVNNADLDAANLIEANKTFIAHEAYGYITGKYPTLLIKEGITIEKCRRDIGYLIDATVQDLRLGGNINTIQAAESYYVANQLSYITGELTETLEGYNYAKDLAIASTRNFTYLRTGASSVSGSALVNVGDTSGIVQGMTVADYDPSMFTNGKLNSGATRPGSPAIPDNTFVKKIVDSATIELGQKATFSEKKVVADRFGDARNLILSNKTFIATEAYERMLLDFPNYTPSSGYDATTGKAKCIDDLEKAITAIAENVGYGGNAETWDAAYYYESGSVLDLANKKDETVRGFTYARDMAIQVMRNDDVFVFGTHGLTQTKDTSITYGSPDAVNDRAGDARGLILANKNLIAHEAVERMVLTSSTATYTPTGATYDAVSGDLVLTIPNHGLTGSTPHSATGASYVPSTGVLTITIPNHGFANGERIQIQDDSLTFTCAMDNNTTTHTYPRVTDPVSGKWLSISNVTTNTFDVHVGESPVVSFTPTNADYNPTTGLMTLTIGNHGLSVGTNVQITQNSLTFTCAQDNHATQHTYPRASDPAALSIPITAATATTITVQVLSTQPSTNTTAHTFVSAAASSVKTGGDYAHTFSTATGNGIQRESDAVRFDFNALTFTCAMDGNGSNHSYPRISDPAGNSLLPVGATTVNTITLNVGKSPIKTYDVVDATYDQNTGDLSLSIDNHNLVKGTSIKLANNSLTFTCDQDSNATTHSYPRSTDPAYNTALTITDIGSSFKTPTGASYDPATGIMQVTSPSHGFVNGDRVKISENSLTFTCSFDGNATEHSYPRESDPYFGKWLEVSNVSSDQFTINVGAAGANQEYTPSTASYDPSSGDLVLTIGTHQLSVGDGVTIDNDSLSFTCTMDGNQVPQAYPRAGRDRASGRSLDIKASTADSITVNVGNAGDDKNFQPSAATYNQATGDLTLTVGQHGLAVGSDIVLKNNSLTFTCDKDSNATQHTYPRPGTDPWAGKSISITSVGSTDHSITGASYTPTTGALLLSVANHGFSNGDYVKIADGALTLSCALGGAGSHTYVGGTVANAINGDKDVTAATYDPATGVMTVTSAGHGLTTSDTALVSANSLSFTCDKDGHGTIHTYPRTTDPAYNTPIAITAVTADTISFNVGIATTGKAYPRAGYDYPSGRWLQISNVATNAFQVNVGISQDTSAHYFVSSIANGLAHQDGTFTINVGAGAVADQYPHTFVSADADAVQYKPQSVHTFVSAGVNCVKHLPQSVHTFKRGTSNGIEKQSGSITVNVDVGTVGNRFGHTFVSATSGAVITGGNYAHTWVSSETDSVHKVFSVGNSRAYHNQDCVDDVVDLLEAVADNVAYGGNEKVWDAAYSYKTGAHVAGEETETNVVFEHAKELAVQAARNQKILSIGSHGISQVIDTTITTDIADPPTDRFGDARNLMIANKDLIAQEAYARMLLQYPTYLPPTGDPQDCLDDLLDFVEEVSYNTAFGGNDRTWDMANLYVSLAICAGQTDQVVMAFRDATEIMIQVLRQEKVLIIGKHGLTQTYDNALTVATQTPQDNKVGDAKNLIDANKNFVAEIALGRMIAQYPNYTWQTGYTSTDCLDDLKDVVDVVGHNLAYGGNDRVWDAANMYVAGAHASGSENETIAAFNHVRDLIIQVMTNETVTVGGHTALTQAKDTTITADTNNPKCPNQRATVTSLVQILTDTISTPTSLHSVTRTQSVTKCEDVRSAVNTLSNIVTNALQTPESLTGITRSVSGATYDPATGDLTLTIGAHSIAAGTYVQIADNSLTFTCGMDSNASNHTYPRTTDPISGQSIAISGVTADSITVNVGDASPSVNYTPTNATYNPSSGYMLLTIGAHSLKAGSSVRLADDGFTFTCTKDGNATNHTYPRATDPAYQTAVNIVSVTSTTITVDVGASGASDQYVHTFVSAAANSLITGGNYPHTFVSASANAITTGGVIRTRSVGKCENVRTSIDTLINIVKNTVSSPTSLDSIVRTSFTTGSCQNVASSVTTLFKLITDAITSTTSDSLDAVERVPSPLGVAFGPSVNANSSTSNSYLYFTLTAGVYTTDYTPTTDDSITQDTGYPQCNTQSDAIRQYFANINTIIQTGLNTVPRTQPATATSALSSRATLWRINGTNPHNLETGTPVRLVPRPRYDTTTNKYVEVDKRHVRLPNGFDTNTKYFVIASGRNTKPENYSTATQFNGGAASQLYMMLASSKENAAAGIYIHSAEVEAIHPDVEIDIYQFVLDDKYDLHQYSCVLDGSVTAGIKTDVPHIFDIASSNTTEHEVFFRANEGGSLPVLGSAYATNPDFADTTTGEIRGNKFFFARYQNEKVFTIHATKNDAIANVNPITFQPGTYDFSVFADKRESSMRYDPTYPNPNTTPTAYGKWYLQVENNSQGAGANSMEILSRFHDATYSDASGQDKTNDSWYERIKDDRDADERIYRLRYVIPQYLQSVRDPLNGFTIKVRKDETRKLLPQKLVLKPVSGSVTKATFYNPVQANEKIGYTDNDFVINSLNSDVAYDPYKKDLVGNTQFVKKIETTNYISMSIQSGRYFTDTQSGDELLELTVFDQDVTNNALLNETFITVAITNPQGGSFVADRSQSNAANRIEWDGNSTGYAYIHAALPTNPNDLNSQWHLILKGAVGPIDFSATDNIRFSQGTVFADLTADPDYGKSLVIKDLIKKGYPEYYYRQNGAALYTITPGDIITDDANIQFYVDSVTDVGDLNDTFYVFDTTQIQKRIFGQQDGIYYLTAVRGNNSPLPTGAGNLGNFRDFKFSQPISKLYPLNYKNDPLWYQQLDATLVDPPQTYSAADNYVHGLVRVNDFKGSMTKEAMEDFVTTLAFENVTFTGDNDKSILVAQRGNASSGSEDRLIPITGHQATGTYPITSQKRMYVELRRPSIARAGNHTFEYLGFGPGNYSTGMPVRQEVVLTPTQDFYAQSKKENGGLVFYTGLNSNGDLYIGNRKINAITGEEEFLERAALVDSEDAEEDIGDLVTTFDTPVTFNQNITVNGGDAQDKDSFFNSPVKINVLGRVRKNSLTIGSYVSSDASDQDDQTLDRGSQTLNTDTFGDVVIGRNRVAASIFQFNPRGSSGAAQGYKIQNHVVGSLGSNITPNQSPLYNTGLGTTIDSSQQVNYGNAGAPRSGDMLLKGNEIGQSGSLGWIYANYFATVPNNSIQHFTMNGSKQITITWGNNLTNQQIGITSGSQVKIAGYSDSAFNGTWLIDPNGFNGSATTCTFNILVNRSSIGADNPRLWSDEVASNPDIKFEYSNSTWMEFGVLGAESIRTHVQNIGDYKVGINTVARANHSAYLNAWNDLDTAPRSNLDVVGTAWISGRTITNFLDEAQYPSRTKVDQDHAFMVGGDSAVPDSTATLRVATSGDGKVGINTVGPGVAAPATIDVTNEVLDSTLTVVGTGRFTDNVSLEQDLNIGAWPDADQNGTVNVTTQITTGTFNFLMGSGFVGTQSNTTGGSKGLLVAGYSQNIEIGNAQTAEQDIKIGNTSTSSEITIGATPSGSGTDISQITIGGADASNESSSYTRVSSRALKVDGDAWLGFGRSITDTVNLASPAGTVEFFSNSGGPSKINFALNASEINVAGQGGTTTINNQLEVIASAKFNADVHLCGGLESFTFTGIRGQLGSTIYAHDDGVLANEQFNKNVDILNVLVKGQTDADYNEVNTEGTDPWGGTEYQNARTNVTPNLPALSGDEYYLPIRDATNGYFAENDYLLIDSGIVGTTRHPEIVQIVELTSVVNSPYYLKVKRQPFGTFTGIITDHQDLTPIYKVNVQFDSTWTEAALDGNGPEDTVDLAEFGGGLTTDDYIFIDREPATPSTGEAIKVGTLLGELEQKLKVSSCGNPDVDVFVVNSVSGNTYIGGTLDINNSVAVSGGCEVLPAGTTLQRTFQGDLVPASAAEPLNYIISGISATDIATLRIGDVIKLNGYAEGNPVVINDDTKILEIHSDKIKISKAISTGQTINDINFRAVENETFVINNGANQNSFYLDTCSAALEIGNQSRRIDITRALPTVQTAADTEAAFDGIEQHIRVYSYWVDPLTFNNGGPVSTLAANAVTDSNHPGDIFLPLTELGENDGRFAIGDLVLVGKTVDLDNNLLQGTDAEVMFVESVDETTNTLRCTPAQEGTTAKPLTTYVATTTTVKRLKKHVDTSPVESIEARNRQLSGVPTPYVSLVISEGYIVPTKLDYPTWVRFVDTREAAAGGTFADQWFYVNGNLFGSVHKPVMNEYLHDGILGHSTGSLKINKDFEMIGGNIDIYDSVRQTKLLSLKNDDGHADHAGTITFEAGVTGRGALTIYPVTCPEQQSGISCDPSFSVDSARNVVAGSTLTVNGEALVNPAKNPKFTVDNLGVNGTDKFVINHDNSIDSFGVNNFYTKTGGRHARYLATGAAAANTYLEANISYFLNIADGDEFVVYLPENPITGDTVNIIEVGGNLTYNTSLIVRAQGTGTKVQGDSSGTTLGGLATAYTAGELVVQTPNAAFTLIYLGGVDSNGSPVGGSYSGWWLKEV